MYSRKSEIVKDEKGKCSPVFLLVIAIVFLLAAFVIVSPVY